MSGKIRDRRRKNHKRKEKAVPLPKDLEMMTALATKRYKVHVLMKVIEAFTVFAVDPEQAVKHIQAGQGRPAGREGPMVVDIKVEEMGQGSEENGPIVDNAETELNPKTQSLIEVVRS